MLDVNPETVHHLIHLAQEFHAQEVVSFPASPEHTGDDWGAQILAAHADDATLQDFLLTIRDLEPDQQDQVVALLWLGRGDFEFEEWPDAVSEARRNASEEIGQYLIGQPMLADFLREGLIRHGYDGASF